MRSVKQVFITGSSRSGTTMMSRILNKHPHILSLQELHFFNSLYVNSQSKLEKKEAEALLSRLLTIQSEGLFSKNSHVNNLKAEKLLNKNNNLNSIDVLKLFFQYNLTKSNSEIICEQTPSNIFYFQELLDVFPDSLILNMIRDPRDVMLSQKHKWKRRYLGAKKIPIYEVIRSYINYHPILIAWFWNSSILHYNKYAKNKHTMLVYFEKLLENPEEIISEICRKINIDFTSEMMNIPNIGSSIKKDNIKYLGFDKSKIQQWRSSDLKKAEIYICQLICGSQMKKHGYENKKFILPPFSLLLYIISFPIYLVISFLLNLNRSANIFRTIRKRFLIK
ncbi:MAG: sulfotransferase [Bacteroidota bacterium]|nr:sulfotransferase [Bacteroidota bacterium]